MIRKRGNHHQGLLLSLRWNFSSMLAVLLLVLLVCHVRVAGGIHDSAATTTSSSSASQSTSSSDSDSSDEPDDPTSSTTSTTFPDTKSSTTTTTTTRTFAPILNEKGEPGRLHYYRRTSATTATGSPDQWAVRYYDPLGLVDVAVPRHFPTLSDDRVVYELQWHFSPQGNLTWTERTILELLWYSLMEPPVQATEIFEHPHYHAKAALKQQQRFATSSSSSSTSSSGSFSSHKIIMTTNTRRTYQQVLHENAVAAAVAHRAGGITASSSSSSSSTTASSSLFYYGIPVIARKMDTAYGWLRDDVDICDWEGIVCGDFSAKSQYYWNAAAGVMTTYHPSDHDSYVQQQHQPETWSCDHCPKDTTTTTTTQKGEDTIDTESSKEESTSKTTSTTQTTFVAANRVTKLELPYAGLVGTLPTEIAMLRYLHRLDLRGNQMYGSLPTTLHQMEFLQYLDLSRNDLTGTLAGISGGAMDTTSAATNTESLLDPNAYAQTSLASQSPQPSHQSQSSAPTSPPSFPHHIREVWLGSNKFNGTIPLNWNTPLLLHLDLSLNQFTGKLPRYGRKQLPKLKSLLFEHNMLSGKLPPKWAGMTDLKILDVGFNKLNGTLPTMYGTLSKLREFNIVGNTVSNTIPTELLKLSLLEALMLSENNLKGQLPGGDDTVPHRAMREPEAGYKWSQLTELHFFHISDNGLTGTLPPDLFYGLSKTIQSLDFAYNEFTGTIPREIAKCSLLERINVQANYIRGTLPSEMSRMNPNLELNFTNNLLTGSIPTMFCGGGPTSMNFLYRQFACDAVLCPPKTFHPTGAATLHSGCRPCPTTPEGEEGDPPVSKLLGRTRCDAPGVKAPVNGDVDGDGIVSPREVLRLLFVETIGRFWGQHFQNWIDLDVNECDLYGVTCVNGAVAKLDLVNAAMCSNGEHKSGLVPDCRGIPTELALLSRMEFLTLTRRQFLVGTIPSEIGLMTKLKYIDISECPYMSGPLPSELGRLTNLKYLNVIGSSFNQSVPSEIFHLTSLEKLHLSNNIFTGILLPSSIGHLQSIKELFYSNNYLHGPIPREVGNLSKLENIEMYGNEFNGTLPETLARCTNLKRIDVFSNKLSGTIAKAIANIESLQILHLKMNHLTGSIPPRFGELPFLSWFDVSHNLLHGTLPATFGQSRSIKDFRLGGNMFYDPIPQSLCTNPNINGGLTTTFGCDGVICPLGTYSDSGHATHADNGCRKCPEAETTMYLGSPVCRPFSQEDILSILFDAMQGDRWPEELRENWKNRHIDVCYWSGVICDTKGDIVSIGFPIAWDDWANEGLAAPLL